MPLNVLMVDDEPDLDVLMRGRFRREIKAEQLTLMFALNGAEALRILKKNPTIDCVLTDLNMPEINGLELLWRIKKEWPTIKVHVISAYGDKDSETAALRQGAESFVTKPIDFSKLKELIFNNT